MLSRVIVDNIYSQDKVTVLNEHIEELIKYSDN